MNKDKLLKIIAIKEEIRQKLQDQKNELRSKSETTESVEELRSAENELKRINTEMSAIEQDIADLRAAIDDIEITENRSKPQGTTLNPMAVYDQSQNNAENRNNTQENKDYEQRSQQLFDTGKIIFNVSETRSALLTGDDGIVKPVGVSSDIKNPFTVSSIIDMVKTENCEGMSEYQYPYMKKEMSASVTKEGNEAVDGGADDDMFGYESIKPMLITTYAEVSKDFKNLKPIDYRRIIEKEAFNSLRRKIGKLIFTGSYENTPPEITGIVNSKLISDDAIVKIDGIDDHTLRNIVLNYGGNEESVLPAVLYLNKKDLIAFGDIRGTKDKKAVYDITPDTNNPNTGVIKDGGVTVKYCLNSTLKAISDTGTAADTDTMIYGQPDNYVIGVFGDFKVTTDESVAFKKRMIAILGEANVGGAVIAVDGFIKIRKKAVTPPADTGSGT